MTKKLHLIISVLLIGIMLFAACAPQPEVPIDTDDGKNLTETEYKFIENGSSDYKIVLAQNMDEYDRFAAEEIKSNVFRASGVNLPIVKEDSVAYSAGSRLILIGRSKFLQDVGLVIPYDELTVSGFKLKTIDSNVFICGGGDYGTLYGAYEFLFYHIGYEAYAPDELYVNTAVKNQSLYALDMSDKPDIAWRSPGIGRDVFYNFADAAKMRVNIQDDMLMRVNGLSYHNTFSFVPKSHATLHPNFFSDDGKQLCYTAHGDNAELQAMSDIAYEKFKSVITEYFNAGDFREFISFTMEDSNTWCTCDDCKAEIAKYGTAAATLIRFINPIAERVKDYVNENWPGKKLNIIIMAYNRTYAPPVKKNAEGNFIPIDDTVILADNISLMFAPIHMEYGVPIYHSKNDTYHQYLMGWNAISSNLSAWLYSANFSNFTFFFDSFASMAENYKYFADLGVNYILDLGTWNANRLSAFDAFKAYCSAKIMWDLDVDTAKLTEDFFNVYYGPAADSMKQMFTFLRTYYAYLINDTDFKLSYNFAAMYDKKYWDIGWVEQLLSYYEQGIRDLESLKLSDPESYEKYEMRVTSESIMGRYLMIKTFGGSDSPAQLLARKLSFAEDCLRINITNRGESSDISRLWENWF